MYHIIIVSLLFITAFLPIGAIAETSAKQIVFTNNISNNKYVRFDIEHRKTYEVEGNSMKHLGFQDGVHVDVVPVSELEVGDIVAFECHRGLCDGAYIKELTKKNGTCYWFEGRKDIWKEDNLKKKSLDSRTTYGWLCDDDLKIYGVAFLHKT